MFSQTQNNNASVPEWTSQSADINAIKHLWQRFEQFCSFIVPPSLTELEQLYKEELVKLCQDVNS